MTTRILKGNKTRAIGEKETMKKMIIPCALVLALMASLLVGCAREGTLSVSELLGNPVSK